MTMIRIQSYTDVGGQGIIVRRLSASWTMNGENEEWVPLSEFNPLKEDNERLKARVAELEDHLDNLSEALAARNRRADKLETLLCEANDSLKWFDHATNHMGCAVVLPLIDRIDAALGRTKAEDGELPPEQAKP